MDGLLTVLTVAGAVGCGLVGGVFFAFSTFVMQGLARLAPPQGIAAMQAINVTAISFLFMLALFGTAALTAALAVWGAFEWGEDFGPYLVAAGVLYLAGVIGVTIAYNVPRNDALAAAGPEDAELWSRYLREWTAGNHVRTIAALAAATVLALALLAG